MHVLPRSVPQEVAFFAFHVKPHIEVLQDTSPAPAILIKRTSSSTPPAPLFLSHRHNELQGDQHHLNRPLQTNHGLLHLHRRRFLRVRAQRNRMRQRTSTDQFTSPHRDWCGPCKVISPVFEQLAAAESKPGRIIFAKVNVDNQRDVASIYGISA